MKEKLFEYLKRPKIYAVSSLIKILKLWVLL
jgi:hypothetical protein